MTVAVAFVYKYLCERLLNMVEQNRWTTGIVTRRVATERGFRT